MDLPSSAWLVEVSVTYLTMLPSQRELEHRLVEDSTLTAERRPMAVYTISPFIGPVVGPLIGGCVLDPIVGPCTRLTYAPYRFIVQNTDWRWCYRVLLIWQFVQIILLFTCVPETYAPVILKHKAKKYLSSRLLYRSSFN